MNTENKIKLLAQAILEQQKYGQISPELIEKLEEIVKEAEKE